MTKERKDQVSATIKRLLKTILDLQDAKLPCESEKLELNKNIVELEKHYRALKYDARSFKRIMKRDFGIHFGNKQVPYKKPPEKPKQIHASCSDEVTQMKNMPCLPGR